MKGSRNVDLTKGNVWKLLFLYSMPLFGSALVQQVYSLVDLLVVGNFAAEGALAVDAVGVATVVINILLAFALGANGGSSVVVARHLGEKDNRKVRETVNTALIAVLVMCAALMVLGFALGNLSLKALNAADEYYGDCLIYLYIYTGSLPFVFLYNLGCGICSALGDSKTPFIFLIVSSVLNIGLDLLFVCVFHWDVAGAAWATFISQTICCFLTLIILLKKVKAIRSEEKPLKFNRRLLKELVVCSVPIILQQSFVSVGNFFVNGRINDARINGMGVDATTGFTTAFKFIVMSTMSVTNMTNGFSNFASQNQAAGHYDRIKKGYWAILCYTMIVTLIFVAVFASCPEFLTRIFIQKEKLTEEALSCSVQYLTIVSCFLPVVCVKIVSDGAVRGCGGNLGFTISTFTDLVLRVILVYILTSLNWGFSGICWAWALGWSISMFIAIAFWILRVKRCLKVPKETKEEAR